MTQPDVISQAGAATIRPKAIVVAEDEVYGFLATAGLGVDLERRCRSVADLWAGLSSGDLDDTASVLLFSDAAADDPADLARALAFMAPHATVFLLLWNPHSLTALTTLYLDIAAAHPDACDPNAPVHVITAPVTGAGLLDALRLRLGSDVYVPDSDTEPAWSSPLYVVGRPAAPAEGIPALRGAGDDAPPRPAAEARPALRPEPVAASSRPTETKPGYTIAVNSSKGGSGKTTTAIGLAGALARGNPGLRVCLVDLDIYDGQVATMLNTYMPTAMSIRLDPRGVTDDGVLANLVTHRRLGISALLAPVKPQSADDLSPEWYRQVLRVLRRHFDVVILDCGVSYLQPLLATVALPDADVVLTVTTLTVTSLGGLARMLRALTDDSERAGLGLPREKFGIVVNGAMNGVHVERKTVLEGSLGIPIVGVVPHAARDVAIATNTYAPHKLLDHPDLGSAYRDLAARVLPSTQAATAPEGQAAGPTRPWRQVIAHLLGREPSR